MITFLQFNLIHLLMILMLVIAYVFSIKLCTKHETPELKTPIRIIGLMALAGVCFLIANTTLYNQVPKTVIDKSYVEQSANKYQDAVIRNANKGK